MTGILRNLFELFDRAERRRLALLVAVMMVSGLLQSVGVASVVPFLAVVSNPETIHTNRWLAAAYLRFGFSGDAAFLMALGALFLIIMIFGNGMNLLTLRLTARVQWRTHDRLSQWLMRRFLHAPYQFHLTHNSAELGKGLLAEVTHVIESVFLPLARLTSLVVSSTFLTILMVWADPLLAVIIAVSAGGFYTVVYSAIRARQRRLGEEDSSAKTARIQISNEAIGGIKELKVLGRQSFFLDQFRNASERHAHANAEHALAGHIPRFALETVSYGGIIVVILYLLKTRQSLDEIFPLLAVYAFSANRLIPAVQEIFHAVTQIRFGSKSLENLHRDLLGPLADTDEPPDAALSGSAGGTTALGCHSDIRFTGVTFQYPGVSVPALRNLSLVIPANTTCAFVGSTGAGKTTVVDLLLGLFPPTGGSILVDGVPLTADRMPAWRRGVGYVPQSIFLCDASITKNIAFGVPDELIDHAAVIEAARAADLDTFVGALREGYDTVVGERGVRLSGGQRQRIGIARALYHKPDVLILDEATSALDNVTEDVVMHAIHAMAGQRTIILIAHRLTTVRDCDRIFVLQHGILVDSGTHDELMVESTTFRALARA